MANSTKTEIRKTDFLKLGTTTGDITKVISPNDFQVGLDDPDFHSSLTVKGNITSVGGITGSITQVSAGVDFLQAGTNISIAKNSDGSLTIGTSGLPSSQALSLGNGLVYNSGTTFDGSTTRILSQSFVNTGGLSAPSSAGSRIDFDNLNSVTPTVSDSVIIADNSNGITDFPRKCTVSQLATLVLAQGSPVSIGNPLTFGQGIKDANGAPTWSNTAPATISVDAATNGGLNITGGGQLYVDPNVATTTTTIDLTNDFVLIYDDSANATRKVALQYVAGTAPSGLTLGFGLQDALGNTGVVYNGSSPMTVSIKPADSTLISQAAGLSVNSVPNELTNGTGIETLAFDGSAPKTISVDLYSNGGLNLNGNEIQLDVNNMTAGAMPTQGDEIAVAFGPNDTKKVDLGSIKTLILQGRTSGTVWVDGGNKAHTTSSISINSNGTYADSVGTDVYFHVSGTISPTSYPERKSVFGGDVHVSGTLSAPALSGSLTRLSDGSPYLRAGANITLLTGSNGSVTISSNSGNSGITGDISNITQANPGVVTTTSNHGLVENQGVTITSVVGMTQVNGNKYYADVITSDTFALYTDDSLSTPVDTTSFSPYTSGGTFTGEASGVALTVRSGSNAVANVSVIDTSLLGKVQDLGGGAVTITGSIGLAEDGSYTDGLFTDFNPSTPVGTAVDRFNEVLKGLAPGAAPNLDDINSADTGTSAKLSFGSSHAIAEYTNVQPSTLSPASSLGDVDINGTYGSTSAGNNLRVAVFAKTTTINGILNADIAADGTNYPQYSFGDGDRGSLNLFVNDNSTPLHTVNLASFGSGDSLNGNSSGFLALSVSSPGHFADGSEFATFQHRTGSWVVAPADQRNGWNYARVVHTINGVDTTTNYVEWVNDVSGSVNDIAAAGSVLDSLAMTGERKLSGVRYHTAGTAEYRVRATNAYRNVYSTSNITFGGTRVSVPGQAFPAIDYAGGETEAKVLHITASATINSDPILDQSISVSVNIPHPLKSDLNSAGNQSIPGILLYNLSNTSTATTETFRAENYRLISGSYDAQSDVTDSSNAWDSGKHMSGSNAGHEDGLMFYNSALRVPREGIASGDFRNTTDGGSITNGPSNNVNYSGITTGTRTFYRYLQNTTGGSKNNFTITINGTGTIASQATSLNTSNIHVLLKIPQTSAGFQTGWMDLAVPFATGQNQDGAGCLFGSLDSSLNATNDGTFGTQSVGNNEYAVIKIEADATWTGNISDLSITWT